MYSSHYFAFLIEKSNFIYHHPPYLFLTFKNQPLDPKEQTLPLTFQDLLGK